jgi:hypothetical protein
VRVPETHDNSEEPLPPFRIHHVPKEGSERWSKDLDTPLDLKRYLILLYATYGIKEAGVVRAYDARGRTVEVW